LSTIDLNTPPPNHQFSVSVEREETPAERGVRLFKDVMLFLVAIGFIAVIVWLCVLTLEDGKSSPDAQKWAMSVLSAAAGGVI
jgi:hypothetical protein